MRYCVIFIGFKFVGCAIVRQATFRSLLSSGGGAAQQARKLQARTWEKVIVRAIGNITVLYQRRDFSEFRSFRPLFSLPPLSIPLRCLEQLPLMRMAVLLLYDFER